MRDAAGADPTPARAKARTLRIRRHAAHGGPSASPRRHAMPTNQYRSPSVARARLSAIFVDSKAPGDPSPALGPDRWLKRAATQVNVGLDAKPRSANAAHDPTMRRNEGDMAKELLEGDPAPDFELPTDGGRRTHLKDLKGKPVVIYFYPKDDMSGYTAEAIAFSGLRAESAAADATVIGVSPDSAASHDKFKYKHDRRSRSPPNRSARRSRPMGCGKRACTAGTFWRRALDLSHRPQRPHRPGLRKVKVPSHADEVLAATKALRRLSRRCEQKGRPCGGGLWHMRIGSQAAGALSAALSGSRTNPDPRSRAQHRPGGRLGPCPTANRRSAAARIAPCPARWRLRSYRMPGTSLDYLRCHSSSNQPKFGNRAIEPSLHVRDHLRCRTPDIGRIQVLADNGGCALGGDKIAPATRIFHGIVSNLEKFHVASPISGANPCPVPPKPGPGNPVVPLVPPTQFVVTSKRPMVRGVTSAPAT